MPDDLLPILVRMAEYAAIELGGAIDTGGTPVAAGADLPKLGLRREASGDLFVMVGKGAAGVAEDRRKEPATL